MFYNYGWKIDQGKVAVEWMTIPLVKETNKNCDLDYVWVGGAEIACGLNWKQWT